MTSKHASIPCPVPFGSEWTNIPPPPTAKLGKIPDQELRRVRTDRLQTSGPERPMPRSIAVITESLEAEPASWLAERTILEHASLESRRFEELAPQIEALLVRTYTRVDEALLGRLPRLRVVGRAGVGLDRKSVV